MADETSSEIFADKTNFISSLNPDSPSFEPTFSSYQHITPTQQRRDSTEEEINNHSHIEPIQNGDHHEANASSTIHPVEFSESSSLKSPYIQETNEISNGIEDPTSSSHIQQATVFSYADALKLSAVKASEPEEEEEESNVEEEEIEETNEVPFEGSTLEANTFRNEPDLTTSVVEDESSTIEQPLIFDTQKPDELKAQRELDDEKIPPADEIPVEVNPIQTSEPVEVNPIETPEPLVDEQGESRPLTALETPFEHRDDVEQNSINESSSSSLPDVVTQTLEQDRGDFVPQLNLLEQPKYDEISLVKEEKTIEDILPPLTPSSLALEQTLDSQSTILKDEIPLANTPPQVDDILGNKTLLKQTIVPGISDTRPTRSTMATVSYTLSLVDNSSQTSRPIESVSNMTFFVGESDILPAIDLSVQLMDRGERSLIDSDVRHCYGELGCKEKQIPPPSLGPYRMEIDLELHEWQRAPDVQTLSIDERLKWGDRKRHMGNFYYGRQDYSGALTCYRGALRFLDTDDNPVSNDKDPSVLNERYVQVQNNVGQVNLLLLKYDACLDAVKSVLQRDPRNFKALFRQGKALFELGKYDEARVPLKLFMQLDTSNAASGSDKGKVTEMLNNCETKLAGYQKSEKEIYRRMFQSTTTATPTSTNKTQSKINQMTDNKNNNWWTYVTLSTAVLAAVGIAAFIKYRKTT